MSTLDIQGIEAEHGKTSDIQTENAIEKSEKEKVRKLIEIAAGDNPSYLAQRLTLDISCFMNSQS